MTLSRWLPHPRLALLLFVLWLLLNQSASAGHVLLGAVLAIVLVRLTHAVLPAMPPVRRPWKLVTYCLLVLYDILVANVRVARLVLGPTAALQPCIVEVPLATRDPLVVSLVAATVTLTPGTVTIAVDAPAGRITVHGLSVDDPRALVAEIRERYERRLLEVFAC